jgi:hypothetical protein
VPDSWLFAKGNASVRILRTGTLTLSVLGPGHVREVRSFTDPAQVVDFLRVTENTLAASGFRFKGYAADRRTGRDRRQTARGIDRRGADPAT